MSRKIFILGFSTIGFHLLKSVKPFQYLLLVFEIYSQHARRKIIHECSYIIKMKCKKNVIKSNRKTTANASQKPQNNCNQK